MSVKLTQFSISGAIVSMLFLDASKNVNCWRLPIACKMHANNTPKWQSLLQTTVLFFKNKIIQKYFRVKLQCLIHAEEADFSRIKLCTVQMIYISLQWFQVSTVIIMTSTQYCNIPLKFQWVCCYQTTVLVSQWAQWEHPAETR